MNAKKAAERKIASNAVEKPIVEFPDRRKWAAWLKENHAESAGVWLRFARKTSGIASVTYDEALEVALCHGWIDGQAKPFSEVQWIQSFSPRRKRSIWSKRNCAKAEALIEAGKMQSAGLAEVERAKADGRWEAAYESSTTITVPEDLRKALEANPGAEEFFATLNKQNRYAVLFRIHTAKKAETRTRRIAKFVEMLGRGEKIYP